MNPTHVYIGMRHPRILIPGAEYHVVARANRGEFIFDTDQLKTLFLSVVERAKKKYSFTIRNFCIMSNHIHFIIRPGEGENLSRIMQWILSVFATLFNKRFGYRGHVWYDRFKSIVIGTLRQFIATFNYVKANPVTAGIASEPYAYRFCGVRRIRDGDLAVVDPPDDLVRLLFPDVRTLSITRESPIQS